MEILKRLVKEESGQSAVEYMVLTCTVVAMVIGVAYGFKSGFNQGVTEMGKNVKTKMSQGFN
jgi:Flp pilus assembly pilin Flp